jgi:hypothetical protein
VLALRDAYVVPLHSADAEEFQNNCSGDRRGVSFELADLRRPSRAIPCARHSSAGTSASRESREDEEKLVEKGKAGQEEEDSEALVRSRQKQRAGREPGPLFVRFSLLAARCSLLAARFSLLASRCSLLATG